jgi:pyruvate dehydrogenase E2 component (dihydrolipoamide acetyltransferase)
MEAGTLVEWLKHPGDTVKRGDIIALVDTQKGAIEIEVFEDGVVEKTVVEPGQQVPIGTVLAVIRNSGRRSGPEDPAAHATGSAPTAGPLATPLPAPLSSGQAVMLTSTAPALPKRAGRARVSPLARTLAADLGVDLAGVTGTGEQGAITRADVERAAGATKATGDTSGAPGVATPTVRQAAMRAAIAAAMTRSKREIPHYYLSATIDLSAAMVWLRKENDRRPIPDRLLPVALLTKAVALALRDVPDLNGHWIDDSFRQGTGIHVGVAISLRGGGLVAPAVHNADTLDLTTLMGHLRDLVARARAGSLKSSELADPTITAAPHPPRDARES